MPGIYVMAILTIVVTTLLGVTTLHPLAQTNRRSYWLIFIGLPLSMIVNRFIKTPFITALAVWTGIPLKLAPGVPIWFVAAVWLNAPIFEEAIKMLPMLLPLSRRFLQHAHPGEALWAGFALGMGFGLGEAAYLAYGLAHSPAYNQLPWYVFTGFAVERLIVTFAHGFMTSLAVMGLSYGRRKAFHGYLTAVGLHALINLGPILMVLKLVPASLSSMASYLAIFAAFAIFQRNIRLVKRASGMLQDEIIYFER
jgi:hypothetical protein